LVICSRQIRGQQERPNKTKQEKKRDISRFGKKYGRGKRRGTKGRMKEKRRGENRKQTII
jgi:hypothetical protein